MNDSKQCLVCGNIFKKPYSCGKPEWEQRRRFCSPACKQASQKGKPTWNAGITKEIAPQLSRSGRKRIRPIVRCVICKAAIIGSNPISKTCGAAPCKEIYKPVASTNIKNAVDATYRNGRKAPGIFGPPISRFEEIISPQLVALGWIPQYLVRTGNESKHYRLDFAIPERMIHVEIDGTIHDRPARREHDAMRSKTLSHLGWQGIRFSNDEIARDIASCCTRIRKFMSKS